MSDLDYQASKLKDIRPGGMNDDVAQNTNEAQVMGDYVAAEERRKAEQKEAWDDAAYLRGQSDGLGDYIGNTIIGSIGVNEAYSPDNKKPRYNTVHSYIQSVKLMNVIGICVCALMLLSWLLYIQFTN